jgi:hypothetical protein
MMTDRAPRWSRERSQRLNELYEQFGREDADQESADYKELMKIPAFRRVLMGIISRARVFGSVYPESNNANELAYLTGRREYGCEIYALANKADPTGVVEAMTERSKILKFRNQRIEALKNETERKETK